MFTLKMNLASGFVISGGNRPGSLSLCRVVNSTGQRYLNSTIRGGADMKAVAVFPGTKEVKVIEQEEPQITQPDQVKLRMLEVGICGTDKEICSFS
jgi:hypothetical protein